MDCTMLHHIDLSHGGQEVRSGLASPFLEAIEGARTDPEGKSLGRGYWRRGQEIGILRIEVLSSKKVDPG